MGSHKVVGKGYVFTKHREITTIGAIFTSTCHTKQLNPWPNSSASRVVIHSQLSACQRKMGSFKGYPSFTKNREMTIIGAIFTSTCHTKQLNPWPNSSPSRVVIHSQLSACKSKMGPFKGYPSFTKNREMTTIGAIFTSTCHTKQLNPWPNSSPSCVVIHSRLSACQRKMGPFKGYPSTRGCQTGLRKTPE